MKEDGHSFYLGLAIIAAICGIYALGAHKGTQPDIAVLTGLIGVLGTFTRRSSGTTQNVQEAGTVTSGEVKEEK